MMEADWLASLAGKSVALVGAAASGAGTGYGPLIDDHDVVVRVNWACPVPRDLVRDLGCRTDALYHVLAGPKIEGHPKGLVRQGHVHAWVEAGVSLLVGITPQSRSIRSVGVMADAAGLPFFPLPSKQLRGLAVEIETRPNAGIGALAHLLRSGLARLDLYAFDFYATGHWLGQADETPEQAAAQVGGSKGHGQREQRAYVRRLLARDDRLVVLPEVRALLVEPVRARDRGVFISEGMRADAVTAP